MKYKVGDKVRVREDLQAGKWYGGNAFVDSMEKYLGQTLTIYSCHDGGTYSVVENVWSWTEEMFANTSQKSKFGGMLPNGVYIKRVLYKNPVVVTFWSDGTKTVSKCAEGDTYNPETGLLLNYLKKLQDSTQINNLLKDWLPENIREYGDITLRAVRKKNNYK